MRHSDLVTTNPAPGAAAVTDQTMARAPVENSTTVVRRGSLGLGQGTALYIGSVLGTGILVLPGLAAAAAGPLVAAIALVFSGELIGRYLFYVTVVPYGTAGSFFRR